MVDSYSDAINFLEDILSYNSSFAMAVFYSSQEISFLGISCVILKVDAMITSLILVNNQQHSFV